MANFTATVKAVLDTKGIQGQLNSLNPNLKIKNIKVDTSSLTSQIQSALSKQKFTINIGNANFSNVANAATLAGKKAGANYASAFNSSLGKINVFTGKNAITNLSNSLARTNFNQSQINTVTKDLQKMSLAINSVKSRMTTGGLRLTVKGTDELGRAVTIIKQFDRATQTFRTLSTTISQSFGNASAAAKKFQSSLNAVNKAISSGSITSSVAKINQQFQSLKNIGNIDVSKYQRDINKLNGLMNGILNPRNTANQIKNYQEFTNVLSRLRNNLRLASADSKSFASQVQVATLQNNMTSWLNKNSKATKQYGNSIKNLTNQLNTLSQSGKVTKTQLSSISDQFKRIKSEASAAGLVGRTFTDQLKGAYTSISKYIGASYVIYTGIHEIREGINTVVELDTALVDLQKTSTATAAQLKEFYYSANDIAKEYGATTQEIIQSAADWSRLGYSTEDAKEMAKVSSIFRSISPGMDMESSTSGLVSIMKAFGIEAEDALDGIASKINIIGNTRAVSNNDIVNFLTKSSSAMAAANNTLEETIALGTAATEITRDAESTGTALKTVSMRIRGYDEETEEYIGGVEQLSGEIADLTKTASTPGGISLFTDEDKTEYKSTVQILRDISQIYDELTDKQQAQLLEKLAGKHRGQVVAAILSNFDAVEASLNSMGKSSGNAMAEMDKIEGSLEYKINALKETGTGIWQNIFQTDQLGIVIEGLTGFLEIIDKVTEHLGLFGTVFAGAVAFKSIKNISKAIKEVGGLSKVSTTGGWGNILHKSFTKVSTAIGQMVVSAKTGGTAFQVMSAGAKSLFGSLLPIVGLTAGIVAFAAVIDLLTVSFEEAKTKADEAKAAYQSTASELSSVSSEIESTNTRIAELKGKGKLTIVEQAELSKLQATNEQLTARRDLLQKIADIQMQSAAESATKVLTEDFSWQNDGKIRNTDHDISTTRDTDGSLVTRVAKRNKKLNQLTDEYNDLLEKQSKLTPEETFFGTSEYEQNAERLENLKNQIDEVQEALSTDSSELMTYYNSLFDTDGNVIAGYEDTVKLVENALSTGYDEVEVAQKKMEKFNDIISSNEAFSKAKDNLIELAASNKEVGITVDDVKNKYPALAQAIQDAGLSVDEFVQNINAESQAIDNSVGSIIELENTLSSATEKTTSTLESINAITEAMNAQTTGKSITLESYKALEEMANSLPEGAISSFSSALEYHNGTLQINQERLQELTKALADYQVSTLEADKATAQMKYLENAKEISNLRKELTTASEDEVSSIQNEINALLEENSTLADTCNQYSLMISSINEATSAYQNWINAQNATQSGEMFDSSLSAFKKINDTLNDADSESYGRIGNADYKAALEFVIPDSVDTSDEAAINSYMNSVKKYLTFDENGNADGLNISRFCKDAVNAGLMVLNESGTEYQIAGEKTMEDFAAGLNMSLPLVQAVFGEMEEFGGQFDWADEASQSIGDLAIKANEAAEALRKTSENQELRLVLDVSEFEDKNIAIQTLNDTVQQMNALKVKPGVDASEIEQANTIIQYCVVQMQMLKDPVVMSVDASQVSGEIGDAILLLQDFQAAQNEVELKAAIGADTTQAEGVLKGLVSEVQGLSPEVKAKLNIDTASAESITNSLSAMTPQVLIKAGIDPSAIINYNPESKTVDVNYTPNTSQLIESFDPITRRVDYVSNLSGLKTYLPSITRWVQYKSYGDDSVDGTAHVSGTAYAGGNWGTAPGGTTLVGELGREIVVDPRTGTWYTVGDNGAEFRDIPKGSIVFNHKQTESLLENGYVLGRATALARGTALVTGGISVNQANKSTDTSSSSTTKKDTTKSSTKSSTKTSSSKTKSTSSDKEDEPESFDWIEILVDRIERAIDRLKTVAESAFKSLENRIAATNEEMVLITNEIETQNQAYEAYMQKAESVGLPDELAEKVRNGSIEINEYDKDTKELIDDYKEWYEKALDCAEAVDELHENLAKLYQDNFDNIQDDFDNQIDLVEHLTNTYDIGIDAIEARGYLASSKYYEAKKSAEQQKILILTEELQKLQQAFSDAMNSGEIEEGSEAWYSMQKNINDTKEAIQEAGVKMLEFNNSIRETEWEHFDYLQERIETITTEADFLIDLLSHKTLINTDDGSLTAQGEAVIGLHAVNYNVYMAQADQYAAEIKKLNAEIANDPYNADLIERREELLKLQQKSILAAEDEKDSIKDLIEEGIKEELNAVKDLIDEYTDFLDSTKDLYDYQRKVESKTKEIAKIRKQLSAYQNDTSEETKSKLQELRVSLQEAEQDLQDTQYDQYIKDQKDLLSELYDTYETMINSRLDNVDALVSEAIDSVNENSSAIAATIIDETESVGYTLSDNMASIWSENTDAINGVVSMYGDDFSSKLTTVNSTLSSIASTVGAMVANSNELASISIDNTTTTTEPTKPAQVAETTQTETQTTPVATTKEISVGSKINAACAPIYSYAGDTNGLHQYFASDPIYTVLKEQNGYLLVRYHKLSSGSTGWFKKSDVTAYKTGGLVDYTGLAQVDGTPSKPELMLNANDTQNFLDLRDVLRSFSNLDLITGLVDMSDMLLPLTGFNQDTSQTYTWGDINIDIDHVEDYDDLVSRLQKDSKFEKMIQSMTVDRFTGGSSLAKNKIRWK